MNPFSAGTYPAPRIRSVLMLCLLGATAATAQQRHDDHDHGDDFEQHGVHEHGKVIFNVALDGRQLIVELDAPADNVIGFEHAPRTDAEKARVLDRAAWLRAGKGLIVFPAAAGCRFQGSELEAPQWKEGESHADYEARLTYQCDQPQRLEWLQLALLGDLQEIHEARVNLVTPSRQASETVKSADTRVRLR